jgi:hypothetical protein
MHICLAPDAVIKEMSQNQAEVGNDEKDHDPGCERIFATWAGLSSGATSWGANHMKSIKTRLNIIKWTLLA